MPFSSHRATAPRFVRLCVVGALTATALATAPAGAPAAERAPGREAMRDRSFTVVAVADSGINPYHAEFRRPELTADPSTYIEGFPPSADAMNLTLDGRPLGLSLSKDREEWLGIERKELVWIPGTNIVGAVDVIGTEYGFLDQHGHGTAVASVAGGRRYGPGSDDVLIVAINSTTAGLRWAAKQPWIDFITNSWTTRDTEPVTEGAAAASRKAVGDGKVVCFASGNLGAPMWFAGEQGPSWHVNVGAASRSNRGEHYYTGWPNDVLGIANVKAASHGSVSGSIDFDGTSAATPNVCGLMAKTLAELRARLGDDVQGPHGKSLATGRGKGRYLKDGRLTNYELIDAVQSTAAPAQANPPHPNDPSSIPALPGAPWVRGGYGIVDDRSVSAALRVLLGRETRPDRAAEDSWIAALDRLRNAIWGDPP